MLQPIDTYIFVIIFVASSSLQRCSNIIVNVSEPRLRYFHHHKWNDITRLLCKLCFDIINDNRFDTYLRLLENCLTMTVVWLCLRTLAIGELFDHDFEHWLLEKLDVWPWLRTIGKLFDSNDRLTMTSDFGYWKTAWLWRSFDYAFRLRLSWLFDYDFGLWLLKN